MAEHQDPGKDERARVDFVEPLVLWRASVRRFEDRGVFADVGAGRDAQAADKPGAEVAEKVPVEIRQRDDVVELGPLDELHTHIVDDAVFKFDIRVILRDLTRGFEPEPVGMLHDVRFVDGGNLSATVFTRVFERGAHETVGARDADRLDRDARLLVAGPDLAAGRETIDFVDDLFGRFAALLEFDTCVEVFSILTEDDKVDRDAVVVGADPRIIFARTDARKEVELLAEVNVWLLEAGSNRRGDRRL